MRGQELQKTMPSVMVDFAERVSSIDVILFGEELDKTWVSLLVNFSRTREGNLMTQLPLLHKHSLGKIESLTVVLKE